MSMRSFLWIMVFLLTACTRATEPLPTLITSVEYEEPAVYTAVIQALYPAEMVVIRDQTATDPDGITNLDLTLERVQREMKSISPETVDGFKVRNHAIYAVSPVMDLGVPYVLLSQADMRQVFDINRDGWQVFYARFPSAPGIITLSRVGFNPGIDEALVYIGNQSHWLAGAGYFIHLRKLDGLWTIQQQVMTWTS